MHAWYSQKQSLTCGVVIYANAEGRLIQATSITNDQDHHTGWDDIQYMGEVETFVERLSNGSTVSAILNKIKPSVDPYRWN